MFMFLKTVFSLWVFCNIDLYIHCSETMEKLSEFNTLQATKTTFLIRFRDQEYRCEITRTVPLSEPDKSVLQGI